MYIANMKSIQMHFVVGVNSPLPWGLSQPLHVGTHTLTRNTKNGKLSIKQATHFANLTLYNFTEECKKTKYL